MLHVDTDLMGTSCFKYTFHKGYVSQSFQYTVVRNGMLAHRRVGHHRHLHPVFRIAGDITDNRSFILFHNAPHQSTISAFGSLIKKLESQICFGIRCLGNHQQARSIFVDAMNKSHVRVIGIVIRYILHVPSQRIDQRAVIVSVSRMHYQPCRFIHHHYVWIFINNSKGNIFRNNFVFITGAIHHHRYDIQRFHFVATLHRLAIGHNESAFGSLLNTVARSIDNTFEQIFVDPDHRLSLIYNHAEVFVKLEFVTDRFYIAQIILQFIRKFFLYHASPFLLFIY